MGLPGAASSFLQVQVTSAAMRSRALAMLKEMSQTFKPHSTQLDFIALCLHGKKIGFDKIIKLIDDLVATLKQEQQDDNDKKEYCEAQFDEADDKRKALEGSISDLDTVIAEAKES